MRASLARQTDRRRNIALATAVAPTSIVRPSPLDYRRGQYHGARTDRPNTRGWHTRAQSPDGDTIGDLPTLRARARDAVRNMPLAASTLLTYQSCVIGRGLLPSPMIDAEFLGMTEDEGDALETLLFRHFMAWSRSRWSSFDGAMPFNAQQRLQLTGRLVNGDHWIIVRRRQMPGLPYSLSLQHVEADLVSTPSNLTANAAIIDGVEIDENGVAVAIHVANHYPGDRAFVGGKAWTRVEIYGSDADRTRMVWHCVSRNRTSQTRGVSVFAPGLELLKAKSDFTDNSMTAALNATIFTVLFKSPRGTKALPDMVALDPITRQPVASSDPEVADDFPKITLGSGNAVSIYDDESMEQIEPKNPSPLYAPFNDSMVTDFCASTGLPRELVLRHFTASFSASKGAINEGWKVIRLVRDTDISDFCEPAYRLFVTELAASGLVNMPGFFTDPLRREAFLAHTWTGPVPGHLNPAQEATAAKTRLETLLSTLEQETAEFSGGSWEANHRQQAKEARWQRAAGLREAIATPAAVAVPPDTEADDASADDFGDPIAPETP